MKDIVYQKPWLCEQDSLFACLSETEFIIIYLTKLVGILDQTTRYIYIVLNTGGK
jgi:hypothetical protein